MEGVSLQLPPASLQADICCSNLSAVHSLTLSLICFFIFPLWYAVGIPRKILKEHGSVLIAPSQQSPHSAYVQTAHIWECKAEKWGAVFPVASLWLRLWSTWPESNYKEGGRQDALSSSFGSSEKSPHTWHFYHQVQKYKKVHSKAHQKEIWGFRSVCTICFIAFVSVDNWELALSGWVIMCNTDQIFNNVREAMKILGFQCSDCFKKLLPGNPR